MSLLFLKSTIFRAPPCQSPGTSYKGQIWPCQRGAIHQASRSVLLTNNIFSWLAADMQWMVSMNIGIHYMLLQNMLLALHMRRGLCVAHVAKDNLRSPYQASNEVLVMLQSIHTHPVTSYSTSESDSMPWELRWCTVLTSTFSHP